MPLRGYTRAAAALACVFSLALILLCVPDAEANREGGRPSLWDRGTLSGDWFGAGRAMAEHGLYLDLGITNVYQHNLDGGLREDTGSYSGSYDLELNADLETGLGIKSTSLYMLAEGSWRAGEGFGPRAVGSIFGVNADEAEDSALAVTQLWLQRTFLDRRVQLRLGKLDLTGGFQCRGCPVTFDGNLFANDETAQFMNSALVNNPTIPFPESGLSAVLHVNPIPWGYVSAGIADAEARSGQAGFDTAFDGDDELVSMFEAGVVPWIESDRGRLRGAYRLGLWHEFGDRAHLDGSGEKSGDTGLYLSLDQMLWLEEDGGAQGLGAFARAGWADEEVNEIESFASAGLNYQGLLPGRDNDVLGIGFAWGGLSDEAGFEADFERAVEIYYNAEVTPWLRVSPDLQVVSNPGGEESGREAVIAGIRVQVDF
jgi:porin